MQRNMMGVVAVLMSCVACGPRPNISATYGAMYREHFAHQMSARTSREVAPLVGDEARRIYNSYGESIGSLPGALGSSGGKGTGTLSF